MPIDNVPMGLGCGGQFTSTRQLSSHAMQCGKNQSVKLTDSLYRKKKKRNSDRHTKDFAKRPRFEEEAQRTDDDNWVDDGNNVSSFFVSYSIFVTNSIAHVY